MSITPVGIQNFARILYLREYLDTNKNSIDTKKVGVDIRGFLNSVKQADGKTPLNTSQYDKLMKDPEALPEVMRECFSQLTDADKTEFIRVYGLTDAAGQPLKASNLTAFIMAQQILILKESSDDLVGALGTLCGPVNNENGYQAPFCAKTEPAVGGDPVEPLPVPTGEAAPFELKADSVTALKANAKSLVDKDTKESDDWGSQMRRGMDLYPWAPNFRASFNLVGQGEGSDLSTPRARVGEPSNRDNHFTLGVDTDIDVSWDHGLDVEDVYRFEPHITAGLRRLGNLGDSTQTGKIGAFVMGRSLVGSTSPLSYLPAFVLGLEYLNYSSDVPNLPNPEEESGRVTLSINEELYNFGNGADLTFDANYRAVFGSQNGLGFSRQETTFGPRLSFDNTTAPYTLGFGGLALNKEYEIRFDQYNPERAYQHNKGFGFYIDGGVDIGKYGQVDFNFKYAIMDKFSVETKTSLLYQYPFNWGTPYIGLDIANSLYLVSAGVNGIPLHDGGDGSYGANLNVGISAGYESILNDGTDHEGAILQGKLGVTFGPRGRDSKLHADTTSLAPKSATLAERSRRMQIVGDGSVPIFSDPSVGNLVHGEVDAYAIASYLVAFKIGGLNPDYTLNPNASAGIVDAKTVDQSEYGYDPKTANSVKLGDVAPVAFFVGEHSSAALAGSQISDYSADVYRITPSKTRVIKIAIARSEMHIAGKIVAKSNEDTHLAGNLIDALNALYKSNPYSSNKQLEFEFKAMVVGAEMFKYAKATLANILISIKPNAERVSDADLALVTGLSTISKELIEVIVGYSASRVLGKTDQMLPTYNQLITMLGGTPSSAAPAPVVQPSIDTTDTLEEAAARTIANSSTSLIPFMNKKEALAAKIIVEDSSTESGVRIVDRGNFEYVDDSNASLNFAVKPKTGTLTPTP